MAELNTYFMVRDELVLDVFNLSSMDSLSK